MERRREPRRPASGRVLLKLDDGTSVAGQLMDVSASGFRAAHALAGLVSGQSVEFEHAGAQGRARVMWNRITGTSVESGFLLTGK